ncbi:acetyltransferase (GNAT) family domain-containing protein [Ditylenchus destructor]|nr:acetyltransferase (GNAT) family domain-containing protein [Ditylenchus destructor]
MLSLKLSIMLVVVFAYLLLQVKFDVTSIKVSKLDSRKKEVHNFEPIRHNQNPFIDLPQIRRGKPNQKNSRPDPPNDPRKDEKSKSAGCSGKKGCKKPQTPKSEGRTLQCQAIVCRDNRKCQKENKYCRVCVDNRCAVKQPRTNEKGKDQAEQRTGRESERKYNRFTPVARKYPFRGLRDDETRPPALGKCILRKTKCKTDKHCQKGHKGRRKRSPNECKWCNEVYGECSHYRKESERWVPNIVEGNRQISIPDSKVSGGRIGFLEYSPKGEEDPPNMYLNYIETAKEYRQRKGVGTALIKYFIEKTVQRDHGHLKQIKLDVEGSKRSRSGRRAAGLYLKCGFTWDHPDDPHDTAMTLHLENYKPDNCA